MPASGQTLRRQPPTEAQRIWNAKQPPWSRGVACCALRRETTINDAGGDALPPPKPKKPKMGKSRGRPPSACDQQESALQDS